MRYFERFKKFIKRFFLFDDTPHKIAGGVALGIFLGIIPGGGVLGTIFFAWFFRLNRLAALAGMAATNIWATCLLLPPAAALGSFLFGENSGVLIENFRQNYSLDWKIFVSKTIIFNLLLPLLVGFIITAGLVALSFYGFLHFLLKQKKIKFKN